MTERDKGFDEGLQAAINAVLDYAEETRADKKHQATNYLQAVATRLSGLKKQK